MQRWADGAMRAVAGVVCRGELVASVHQAYRRTWPPECGVASAAVTVASASLTASPSTVGSLPTTLTGQITNFIDGQTVTFRLDDPNSGQALSGSISPSPVPSSGTASVSVTIPTGVSNGSHTVYAVGSPGGTFQASNSCSDGAPSLTTASTGLRAVLSGWSR